MALFAQWVGGTSRNGVELRLLGASGKALSINTAASARVTVRFGRKVLSGYPVISLREFSSRMQLFPQYSCVSLNARAVVVGKITIAVERVRSRSNDGMGNWIDENRFFSS
jgi:hypothetical protein